MQRVKDVLQSIFHLDICSFLTLSQLVCVNLDLYHTQFLFVLYRWCSLWGSLSLPVVRGQSVCWDMSAVPASPWDYFLCSLLEIRDTFKGMGTIWNHVFRLHPWVTYNEGSEDTTDEPVFLVLTFISHLQLKNANLMGQVVNSSGTFPISLSSLHYCKGKAVQFFSYYYIFQRIHSCLGWDFVWQVSVPFEFFMLEL